jgi:alpha-galactosidase
MSYLRNLHACVFLLYAALSVATIPSAFAQEFTYKDCTARWDSRELSIGNSRLQRRWQIANGLLVNTSLKARHPEKEWLDTASEFPSPAPEFAVQETCRNVTVRADTFRPVVVEATSLHVTVVAEYPSYTLTTHYKIYPDTPAISSWLTISQRQAPAAQTSAGPVQNVSGGNEAAQVGGNIRTDLNELLMLNFVHRRLSVVSLMDQTDIRDNLVHENTYLLTNSSLNDFAANLFLLEDQFSGEGLIFLKEAPLPHARPVPSAADLRQNAGRFAFTGLGAGTDSLRESYPFTVLLYRNGRSGAIKTLQQYQRQFRNYDEARDELIWHSIWGDRNRDGRMNEEFLMKEMELNRQTGIDHLYFIDGWQKGPSSNSVNRDKGGLWDNQWSQADYWEPNRERFPNGFDNLVKRAQSYGFKVGMWFNPDKTDHFVNWQRETDLLLGMHRRYGSNYFKFDGVSLKSKAGEINLLKAMHRVVQESGGQAGIEIDITADLRTGYFAAMQYGTLFIENRYTDWRKYYPHTTLRNLWQLAEFVDPRRMRMEFLNPDRNAHLYPDDPLAPARYPRDYGLAVTLFAKPMAWFETSGLTDSTRQAITDLLRVYKPHQSAIHRGTIYPLGEEPSGFAWTGFQSHSGEPAGGYVIVYRELNPAGSAEFRLHECRSGTYRFTHLAGKGKSFTASIGPDGKVSFRLPGPQNFALYQYQLTQPAKSRP